MRIRIYKFPIIVCFSLLSNAAWAAPPASCAHKFVGVWSFAGGTTRVNANGTANPTCPMCVAVQTWTCSGNAYIITGPTSYTATLTPDGRQIVGSAGVATRVGGRAVAAKTESSEPEQTAKNAKTTRARKEVSKQKTDEAKDASGLKSDDENTYDLNYRGKRTPITKCDNSGCWIEYSKAPPKNVATKNDTSLRDELRRKLADQKDKNLLKDVETLQKGNVSPAAARQALKDNGYSDARINSAMQGYK